MNESIPTGEQALALYEVLQRCVSVYTNGLVNLGYRLIEGGEMAREPQSWSLWCHPDYFDTVQELFPNLPFVQEWKVIEGLTKHCVGKGELPDWVLLPTHD